MKAIIKFKLPDDDLEFTIHNMAQDMAGLLWELTHNVRKKCEWDIERGHANGKVLDAYDGVYLVFDKVTELLAEYNIDPDKLG
jgi:hypothetical protein